MSSVSVFVELNPRADAFRGLRVRLEIIHIITGKPPQRRVSAMAATVGLAAEGGFVHRGLFTTFHSSTPVTFLQVFIGRRKTIDDGRFLSYTYLR
jgi:hypothetical protein